MPFHLLKHEPITPGLRRIAHEQIDIAVGNFADDSIPVDRQVHSLRTRCKKLRGLLRLPEPLMADSFAVEDQRFRAAAKELAPYRDQHVFAKAIRSLGGTCEDDNVSPVAIPAAAIEHSLQILTAAQNAVDRWPLGEYGFADFVPGFAKTYRTCVAAWDQVLLEPSDEHFHHCRKWTKYHWYQIRILERLNKRQLRKRRVKLRELQLLIGDAHDLAMLQEFLASQPDHDQQLLQRAISRKHELYARGLQLGREVCATRVDDLVADLSRWWTGWLQ